MFALARALRVVPNGVESSSNGTRKKKIKHTRTSHAHTIPRHHACTNTRTKARARTYLCCLLLFLLLLLHFLRRIAPRGHPFLRGSSQGAAARTPLPSLLSALTQQQHNAIPTADHHKHTERGMPCHARRRCICQQSLSAHTATTDGPGCFLLSEIDRALYGDTVYCFLSSRPAVVVPSVESSSPIPITQPS